MLDVNTWGELFEVILDFLNQIVDLLTRWIIWQRTGSIVSQEASVAQDVDSWKTRVNILGCTPIVVLGWVMSPVTTTDCCHTPRKIDGIAIQKTEGMSKIAVTKKINDLR